MARERSVIEVLLTAKDNLSGRIRTAGSTLKKFQGTITAVSTGFLALRQVAQDVVAAFDAVVGQTIREARELVALNRRLGAGVEALQELKFVAEQNNVAFNQLALGLQRATRRIAEAAEGGGEAKAAIEELGLSAQELAKLAPEELFERLADSLAGVKDQSDRVRLAFKFFDSEGVSILQTFGEGGAEDIRKLRNEFVALGGVIGEKMVEQLDEQGKALDRLQVKWDGFRRSAGGKFAAAVLRLEDPLAGTGISPEGGLGRAPQSMVAGLGEGATALGTAAGDLQALVAELNELATLIRTTGPKRPEVPELTGLEEAALRSRLARLPSGKEPARGRVEEMEKQVALLKAMGEDSRDLGAIYDGIDQSLGEMTSTMDGFGMSLRAAAEGFLDNFSNSVALAVVQSQKFSDLAKRAFQSFAIAAVAELNRVIAKLLIVAAFRFFTFSAGGTGAIGGAGTAGGPTGTEVLASALPSRGRDRIGGPLNMTIQVNSVFAPSRTELLRISQQIGAGLSELGFVGSI